ncbi:hypothetical protein BO78DRAFT_49790 [Aspergillus sclerotiicarbonarius CBS 121057]|uniref:Uncharacterized protein n=1 Tax=Aspergillus sclerotiicarbonarius (strain CBS 121057 / IBT 28362) TaxID=1448318 RepID=A0A319FL76_ASPSB|nr:hypothetical protein BO78DRAFT_49790 [Aspergillus sclerotiicarbonarius CBS 121057]
MWARVCKIIHYRWKLEACLCIILGHPAALSPCFNDSRERFTVVSGVSLTRPPIAPIIGGDVSFPWDYHRRTTRSEAKNGQRQPSGGKLSIMGEQEKRPNTCCWAPCLSSRGRPRNVRSSPVLIDCQWNIHPTL